MRIKEIARSMNNAKNVFIKWLKEHNATNISIKNGDDKEWRYYRVVEGFICNRLYSATFMIWRSTERIDYSDEQVRYRDLTIDKFLVLINKKD